MAVWAAVADAVAITTPCVTDVGAFVNPFEGHTKHDEEPGRSV